MSMPGFVSEFFLNYRSWPKRFWLELKEFFRPGWVGSTLGSKFAWRMLLLLIFVKGCAIHGCYPAYWGHVVDEKTGAPIEGAIVLTEYTKRYYGVAGPVEGRPLDAQEAVTDKNGRFIIWPESVFDYPTPQIVLGGFSIFSLHPNFYILKDDYAMSEEFCDYPNLDSPINSFLKPITFKLEHNSWPSLPNPMLLNALKESEQFRAQYAQDISTASSRLQTKPESYLSGKAPQFGKLVENESNKYFAWKREIHAL